MKSSILLFICKEVDGLLSPRVIYRFLDVGLGTKDLADFNIGVQVIGNHIGNFNLMYSVFNL